MGRGSGILWEHCVLCVALPSLLSIKTAWGPLSHPIAGAMFVWTSSLRHRHVSFEKRMCSQEKYTWECCIVPSLGSFDGILCKGMDDKIRMQLQQHPSGVITHRRAAGFRWVEEVPNAVRVQLGLWPVWSIKICFFQIVYVGRGLWWFRVQPWPIWGHLRAGCWSPSPVRSHVSPRMESHHPSR